MSTPYPLIPVDVSRPQLPKIRPFVYWNGDSCGLIVSLHGPSRNIHSQTVVGDPCTPQAVDDKHVWMAFYPRLVLNRGRLFGRLDLTDRQLFDLVEELPGHRFSLPDKTIKSWTLLEEQLMEVACYLWQMWPDFDKLPTIEFPSFPQQYGYRNIQKSRHAVVTSARASIDAFPFLSAVVAFFLSFYLNTDKEFPFNFAFDILHRRRDNAPTIQWLTDLQDSYICNLLPGMRAGLIVQPLNTGWGEYFRVFVRAGVPIWIIWGHPKDLNGVRPIDPYMWKFLPCSEMIEKAQSRFAAVREVKELDFDHVLEKMEENNSNSDHGMGGDHSWNVGGYNDSDDIGAGEHNDGGDYSRARSVSPGPRDTDDLPAGSYQRPGEHWEDFFARMERERQETIERESEGARQKRESREANAKRQGPTKRSKVFEWVQTRTGFWKRIRVQPRHVEQEMEECPEHQQVYLGHRNEWDLCPQLPEYPPGEESSPVEEVNMEEDRQYDLDPKPLERLGHVHYEPLEEVSEFPFPDTVGSNMQFSSEPFPLGRYLFSWHGFRSSDLSNWHPSLHATQKDVLASTYMEVAQHLLHSSLGGFGGNPEDPNVRGAIDFHNTVMNATIGYASLPKSWDMSQENLFPLQTRQGKFCLTFCRNPNGSVRMYVISPPKGSTDETTWRIATKSASTVLFIYRQDWTTMKDVACGLLDTGAAFWTALSIPRSVQPKPIRHRKGGLGLRPEKYQPTRGDLQAYLEEMEDLLISTAGRAIRLRGGLVGRLAREYVGEKEVLDGPCRQTKILYEPERGDRIYVDDDVTEEMLGVLCGVYCVATDRYNVEKHLSWWPKVNTWDKSGFASNGWTPDAEQWYQNRWRDIRSGKALVFHQNDWKKKLRRYHRFTSKISDASERLSSDFISKNFGDA